MELSVEVGVDDVADRYEGVLTDQFDTIDKAASRWGSRIQARLDDGTLTVNGFKSVIAEAVLRVLRNPDGYTNETEGNYSYGLNKQVASGYLMFTRDNISDLIGVTSAHAHIGTTTIGLHGIWS
jgi:hypothetical protein